MLQNSNSITGCISDLSLVIKVFLSALNQHQLCYFNTMDVISSIVNLFLLILLSLYSDFSFQHSLPAFLLDPFSKLSICVYQIHSQPAHNALS